MKLTYPQPYLPIFTKYNFDLDPLLLYAVAHKESKFNPQAISIADARGLMQIHPDRAAAMVENHRLDLHNPYINVTLGAYHLSHLLDQYSDKLHWALGAYNASEEATDSWVKRFSRADPILQIDLITYRETRNYVSMVLVNYFWYRRLYKSDKLNPVRDLLSLKKTLLLSTQDQNPSIPEIKSDHPTDSQQPTKND